MPAYVAAKLVARGPSSLVYLCCHNPAVDVCLLELTTQIRKSEKDVTLVVILPPWDLFEESLQNGGQVVRLHANKEASFVATASDFCSWLTQLTTGIFPRLLLVIPFRSSPPESDLWESVSRIVHTEVLA